VAASTPCTISLSTAAGSALAGNDTNGLSLNRLSALSMLPRISCWPTWVISCTPVRPRVIVGRFKARPPVDAIAVGRDSPADCASRLALCNQGAVRCPM
jgi:hypothetical protein